MLSETADNICWARYTSSTSTSDEPALPASVLARMDFQTTSSTHPLHIALSTVRELASKQHRRVLVVTGRSRRLAVETHAKELKDVMAEYARHRQTVGVGSEVRKTLGDVASAYMVSGVGAGMVVVQAAQDA
jgi:hypothetical protein